MFLYFVECNFSEKEWNNVLKYLPQALLIQYVERVGELASVASALI